jgi:hypothetical protein
MINMQKKWEKICNKYVQNIPKHAEYTKMCKIWHVSKILKNIWKLPGKFLKKTRRIWISKKDKNAKNMLQFGAYWQYATVLFSTWFRFIWWPPCILRALVIFRNCFARITRWIQVIRIIKICLSTWSSAKSKPAVLFLYWTYDWHCFCAMHFTQLQLDYLQKSQTWSRYIAYFVLFLCAMSGIGPGSDFPAEGYNFIQACQIIWQQSQCVVWRQLYFVVDIAI